MHTKICVCNKVNKNLSYCDNVGPRGVYGFQRRWSQQSNRINNPVFRSESSPTPKTEKRTSFDIPLTICDIPVQIGLVYPSGLKVLFKPVGYTISICTVSRLNSWICCWLWITQKDAFACFVDLVLIIENSTQGH